MMDGRPESLAPPYAPYISLPVQILSCSRLFPSLSSVHIGYSTPYVVYVTNCDSDGAKNVTKLSGVWRFYCSALLFNLHYSRCENVISDWGVVSAIFERDHIFEVRAFFKNIFNTVNSFRLRNLKIIWIFLRELTVRKNLHKSTCWPAADEYRQLLLYRTRVYRGFLIYTKLKISVPTQPVRYKSNWLYIV